MVWLVGVLDKQLLRDGDALLLSAVRATIDVQVKGYT